VPKLVNATATPGALWDTRKVGGVTLPGEADWWPVRTTELTDKWVRVRSNFDPFVWPQSAKGRVVAGGVLFSGAMIYLCAVGIAQGNIATAIPFTGLLILVFAVLPWWTTTFGLYASKTGLRTRQLWPVFRSIPWAYVVASCEPLPTRRGLWPPGVERVVITDSRSGRRAYPAHWWRSGAASQQAHSGSRSPVLVRRQPRPGEVRRARALAEVVDLINETAAIASGQGLGGA